MEGNRWYADVPLFTNDDTAVAISFQHGACVRSQSIVWTPLNLLSGAACPMLRCGDALQFTAYPSGATSGVVSITVDGQTHQTTPAAPVICRFTNAGVHTVSGTYSAGAPVSTSITVTVVGGGFPTNEPVCWWGKSRTWNCPNLPTQTAVEGGANLTVDKSATTVTLLLTEGDAEHYVAARLGTGGPLLDSRRIAKMWLRATVDGVVYKIGQEGDGTAIVQNRLTTATFPATATVQLQIFKSGVTFADGTVNKYVGRNDLDERGEYIYQLYMAPSVVGGPCHNIIVSQESERVGVR